MALGMAEDRDNFEPGSLFPGSPRVIFARPPLTEVVAQVRFPPILKITQAPLADFQERVRGAFPLFDTVTGPTLPLGAPPLPAEFLQILGSQFGGTTYRFQTEKRDTALTLSTEALTLATSSYTRWEEFLAVFRGPLAALVEQYAPSFYNRIGLRYINAIQRENLNLSIDRHWSSLIRRDLLGETALPTFEPNLQEVTKKIRVKMTNPLGALLFQHGLFTFPGRPTPAYMIDFDIYRDERTEARDAEHFLSEYHTVAGNGFRWCIEPELFDALGPTRV